MDIRAQLLKEHSKKNTQKIANYIGEDKKRFKALMSVFLNDEYRVVQRASWAMNYCADKHPKLIYPYLEKLLKNLDKKNIHDAVIRNTVRILQFIEIPEKLLGLTYDKCYSLLTSRKYPIAVKVFSMTVLTNICKKEPELKKELIEIIKNEMEYESAAYKSRGKRILSQLNKIN